MVMGMSRCIRSFCPGRGSARVAGGKLGTSAATGHVMRTHPAPVGAADRHHKYRSSNAMSCFARNSRYSSWNDRFR
jgi:hypothetical protein